CRDGPGVTATLCALAGKDKCGGARNGWTGVTSAVGVGASTQVADRLRCGRRVPSPDGANGRGRLRCGSVRHRPKPHPTDAPTPPAAEAPPPSDDRAGRPGTHPTTATPEPPDS